MGFCLTTRWSSIRAYGPEFVQLEEVRQFYLVENSCQVIHLAGISIFDAKMNAYRGPAIRGRAGGWNGGHKEMKKHRTE